ncbi:hypothetical protein GQ53DRAFT_812327 [Thozetella sp. PMI_491]|nr:hypothetical protein GQ53DRAFT_812327 [Thozetella sp. PMI_491]
MATGKAVGPWPNGAQAAIAFTLDNMGEAADLNRKLWPDCEPIGRHYSVTKVLPVLLPLLKKYDISVTYFIEGWNIQVYGDSILGQIAAAGHEVGWHAWQHEAWVKLGAEEEAENFTRSFGPQGFGKWLDGKEMEPPAGEMAASIKLGPPEDRLTVLPFKWATVDAYFYMETFAGLRRIKGEYPEEPQAPPVLVARVTAEIDKAIRARGFLAILFHPFLTDNPERLEALDLSFYSKD